MARMNRPIARRALRLRASLLAQRSARRSAALLSAALLSAGVLAGCGAVPADEPTAPPLPGLSDLIREQAELHPAMRAEDLYKLVYQATRGPRHIFMGDDSQLEAGLDEEVARMAPSPVEGEPMSDGAIVAALRQQLHEVVGEALGVLVCAVPGVRTSTPRPAAVVPLRPLAAEPPPFDHEAPFPDDADAPMDPANDGAYAVAGER